MPATLKTYHFHDTKFHHFFGCDREYRLSHRDMRPVSPDSPSRITPSRGNMKREKGLQISSFLCKRNTGIRKGRVLIRSLLLDGSGSGAGIAEGRLYVSAGVVADTVQIKGRQMDRRGLWGAGQAYPNPFMDLETLICDLYHCQLRHGTARLSPAVDIHAERALGPVRLA